MSLDRKYCKVLTLLVVARREVEVAFMSNAQIPTAELHEYHDTSTYFQRSMKAFDNFTSWQAFVRKGTVPIEDIYTTGQQDTPYVASTIGSAEV